jgi:hypothetical protein
MDFWQTVKVVIRRPYITFPAFLAVLGVAGLVYGSVPTQMCRPPGRVHESPTRGVRHRLDFCHADSACRLGDPRLGGLRDYDRSSVLDSRRKPVSLRTGLQTQNQT